MRIVKRKTIEAYMHKYPVASTALQLWFNEMRSHNFQNFNELKSVYGNASIIANDRVVFNIKGNSYRLIIAINFYTAILYVIWFGTHSEYDRIDAATIEFKD